MRLSAFVKLFSDSRTSYRALTTLGAAVLLIGAVVAKSWGLAAVDAVLLVIGVG